MFFDSQKKLYWNLRQMQYFLFLKMGNKKLSQICTHFQIEGVKSQN